MTGAVDADGPADTDLRKAIRKMLECRRKPHDRTVDAVLNRLFRESLNRSRRSRRGRRPPLDLDKLEVLPETWDIERLGALDRPHEGAAPKCEDLPIIVVRWENVDYLVDGTNRINKWVADGRTEPAAVLAIIV